MAPDAGQQSRFGAWVIERQLGEGGMASVYLARDAIGRGVALKLMSKDLAKDPQFTARFINEARAGASLRHPNIIEMYAYGEENGQPYIASELIDGPTLESMLAEVRPLPVPVALEIFAQVMEAVAFAHTRGIVHRDLKPANLLLSRQGLAKLADFGIAKIAQGKGLTQTGDIIGTPAYMSPEQAAGKPVDARSDLFSAGVMFYEMLSGVNPHEGVDAVSCLMKLLEPRTASLASRAPHLPPSLAAVVDRLLERDVQARPASAAEVLTTLGPVLQPQRARQPGLLQRFVASPREAAAFLQRDQSALWEAEARALLQKGLAGRRKAAFLIYRALRLSPQDPALRSLFADVLAGEGLTATLSTDPKVMALERQVATEPNPELLKQLAGLHRQKGNVFRAAELLTAYLSARPDDLQVRTTLELLMGERAPSRSSEAQLQPSGPASAELARSLASDVWGAVSTGQWRWVALAGALLLLVWGGVSVRNAQVRTREAAAAAELRARALELKRAQAEVARAEAEERRAAAAAAAADLAAQRVQTEEGRVWFEDQQREIDAERRRSEHESARALEQKQREERRRQPPREVTPEAQGLDLWGP